MLLLRAHCVYGAHTFLMFCWLALKHNVMTYVFSTSRNCNVNVKCPTCCLTLCIHYKTTYLLCLALLELLYFAVAWFFWIFEFLITFSICLNLMCKAAWSTHVVFYCAIIKRFFLSGPRFDSWTLLESLSSFGCHRRDHCHLRHPHLSSSSPSPRHSSSFSCSLFLMLSSQVYYIYHYGLLPLRVHHYHVRLFSHHQFFSLCLEVQQARPFSTTSYFDLGTKCSSTLLQPGYGVPCTPCWYVLDCLRCIFAQPAPVGRHHTLLILHLELVCAIFS